jgi:ADP-dependent phosphofructokinase/glucokinase
MANFLTSMGVNTIVYTPLLSEEQCSLFSGDVLIVTDSGLKHPSNAKRPDDKKINWVFEYNKGDVLCGIMATTSCRFIAAARPDTFRIKNVNIKFAKNADCVIISGFQGIKEKYNDGETCNEQFKKSQNMIMKLKEMKKPVHLELASIKNDNTRKQVIEKIIPLVDSMGMDDMELADMLSAVGEKTLAGKIRKSRGVIDVFNGLIELKKRFAPEKIQLHGDCYLLSICDHDYHVTPEEIKKSMEFASIAAAAKAIGKLNSRSDVWNGLTVEESKSAGKKEKILEGYLRKRGTVLKDGIAKLRKTNVIFVRSRMAPQVEDVVGLGDIISASIFAAENAYRLSNTKK